MQNLPSVGDISTQREVMLDYSLALLSHVTNPRVERSIWVRDLQS